MTRNQFLKIALGTAGLAVLTGGDTVFIERYWVQFNHYRIPVPQLPAAFTGLKIAQLTDIHYGFFISLSHLKRLMREVNACGADLIVTTGDNVHQRNNSRQIDSIWPVLCKLQAPMGVYSVLGNHDHWASTERSRFWIEKSGQDLERKVVCLEKKGQRLWLAGLGDLWEDAMDADLVLNQIPPDDCRIVLAHNPDSADTPFQGRIDLMLAGHTHGGQVNFPFIGTPILPVDNKTYSFGLKQSLKKHPVFISRGIGCTMIPVRLNCFAEVPIIELVPVNITEI